MIKNICRTARTKMIRFIFTTLIVMNYVFTIMFLIRGRHPHDQD